MPLWAKIACVLIGLGLLSMTVRYIAAENRSFLFAEGGPVESTQFVAWLIAAAVCAVSCARGPLRNDRLIWAWRCVLALMIAARELDLQEKLNSDTLGDLGVHYRIDWWLDETVPFWLRAMWAFLGLIGIILVVAPPLMVRPPTLRLLRAGEVTTWLFVSAFALLFVGYAFDDLLGRGTIIESIYVTQAIEELAELAGVLAYVGSCVTGLAEPYTTRKARILAQSQ